MRMSSNYNNRGRDRGRGDVNRSRRYWDSDDYKDRRDRDRDYDSRRRSRRDYSRSKSRSYSRSKSRSPSPRRGRGTEKEQEEYQPKPVGIPPPTQQYEPTYIPTPIAPTKEPSGSWAGTFNAVYEQPPPNGADYQQQQLSMQMQLRYEQALKEYHMNQQYVPSSATEEYFEQSYIPTSTYEEVQNQNQNVAVTPAVNPLFHPGAPATPTIQPVQEKKKDKKEKKKKKRRHRSSSSSSSSSSDSNQEREKRKNKVKNSLDESSSSEYEKTKGKDKAASGNLTLEQKETLLKQRENYKDKLSMIENEVKRLKIKEMELVSTKADRKLVEENLKLQTELKGRCNAINIIMEKIADVLKDSPVKKPIPPPPPKLSQISASNSQTSIPSLNKEEILSKKVEYIDGAQHWCRLCNIFPISVKDMLDHFHSDEHHAQVEQLGIDEKPWRKRDLVKDQKVEEGARKVPMRGMQFFSPVVGWYCRLCNVWMGDVDCATVHLKSEEHNVNYMNFLEEHPDWETKWSNDREKARTRAGLGVERKTSTTSLKGTKIEIPKEEGPDDDQGKSIRVQMRNLAKGDERRTDSFSLPQSHGKNDAIDEWMGKPTKDVKIDVVDTQKFAAIVQKQRQTNVMQKVAQAASAFWEDERETNSSDRAREKERMKKFEVTSSGRRYEVPKDKHRNSGTSGNRRRSRSRSRSRERPERIKRRRSPSPLPFRPKEREKEKEKEVKEKPEKKAETMKKMPMIGRMPILRKPIVTMKEREILEEKVKEEEEKKRAKATEFDSMKSVLEFNNLSNTFERISADPTMSAVVAYAGLTPVLETILPKPQPVELPPPVPPPVNPVTGLTDDLQHALDLIYSGQEQLPGVEQQPEQNYMDYSSYGFVYEQEQPPASEYSNDFDGYEAVEVPGLDPETLALTEATAPTPPAAIKLQLPSNSVNDSKAKEEVEVEIPKEQKPEAEDDLDDLRMLGIDVDDTAAAYIR